VEIANLHLCGIKRYLLELRDVDYHRIHHILVKLFREKASYCAEQHPKSIEGFSAV